MLIKSITLDNFKGIQEATRIELKPITLLFGANSAGKSTILQALLYAREVLERHNLDPDKTLLGGDLIDLGGFKNLVNQHDLSKDIVIGFELDISNQDLPNYLSETEAFFLENYYQSGTEQWLTEINTISFKIRIKWSALLKQPIVKSVHYYINEHSNIAFNDTKQALLGITASDDGKNVFISSFDTDHPLFQTYSDDREDNTSELAVLWDEAFGFYIQTGSQNVADQHGVATAEMFGILHLEKQDDSLPNEGLALTLSREAYRKEQIVDNLLVTDNFFTSLLSSLAVGSIDLVRNELEKLTYIGPLRDIPSRHHNYSRSPDSAGWANGSAAWNVLYRSNDAFISKLNHWLDDSDKLDSGYAIKVKKFREVDINHPITTALKSSLVDFDSDYLIELLESLPIKTKVLLNETASDLEVHPSDIGVGISQLLPVIVAVLYQRSGLISVEQPELHIHPRLQVALGDLFASQVNNEDIDTIYLLETHSEHLILRLLRRIRETSAKELPADAPKLTPDDVAVLYIESSADGMKINNLKITGDGDFEEDWPKGFFDERDEELF